MKKRQEQKKEEDEHYNIGDIKGLLFIEKKNANYGEIREIHRNGARLRRKSYIWLVGKWRQIYEPYMYGSNTCIMQILHTLSLYLSLFPQFLHTRAFKKSKRKYDRKDEIMN